MVTSPALSVLIGTVLLKCATTASIKYEPIKITVNENYNAQPGQVFQELESLKPGVVHQGSNFFIKPQLNLPPNYIPPHIEALLSLLQQHEHYCAKDTSKVLIEKDKLLDILKPIYTLSDISKQKLSKGISTKPLPVPIIIDEEPKPVITEILDIPEGPVLTPLPDDIVEEVKQEILEEPADVIPIIPESAVRPISEAVINYVEVQPKPIISEIEVIPEAPVLPPLQLKDIHIDKEEVEVENALFEPVIMEVEQETVVPEVVGIPEAPILSPLSLSPYHVIEDVKIEEPVVLPNSEKVVISVESNPTTPEVLVIPDTHVLPLLSLNSMPPIVEEEVIKKGSVILEKPTEEFSAIPEVSVSPIQEQIINLDELKPIITELEVIPEAPALLPLSLSDVHIDKEEVEVENPLLEPVVFEAELETTIPELVAIPEAPVLPPLNIPSIFEEKEKNEKSMILEEPMEVFSAIPEISVSPIQEQTINYVEPKPIISEFKVIPDAPVLPPLTFNNIPSIVEEEVKTEESVILEEPTEVFPTISEISVSPIQEQIINYVESEPMVSEFEVIPEAPALPPLLLSDVHLEKEEVEIKNPLLKPAVIEIELETAVPEVIDIPEAPILPPLSLIHDHVVKELKIENPVILPNPEKIVIDVEHKPATPEVLFIPDAPVLPSLSLNNVSPMVEEVKGEESIRLEEPTEVFSAIPEISVTPIQEAIIDNIEPKPIFSELEVIPEFTALPTLSLNDVLIEREEAEVENPLLKPVVIEVDVETKIPEIVAIPEPPVLPSLTLANIPSIVEEKIKKEKSIILEEPTEVFPVISDITANQIQEPIIYVGPKPIVSELEVIPEAPVLPILVQSDINVIEEVKVGNPILDPVIVEEQESAIPELTAVPDAPILPPQSLADVSSTLDGVDKVKSIVFRNPSGIFPTIPEISVRPISEPFINYVEPKSAISELGVISEARFFEEPIEAFSPFTKMSSGVNLQEPEISNSYVLKEVPGLNPFTDVTVKKTFSPSTIAKPLNNLKVINYSPRIDPHHIDHASDSKQPMVPNPEHFIIKKNQFRFPVMPFPKPSLSKSGDNKQFVFPRSFAHDIVEKRVAQNKMYVRANVPRGPSNL